MWKDLLIISLLAILFQIYLLQQQDDGKVATSPHPELQWHLRDESPFVTVHNILPDEVLKTVLSEIEKSIHRRRNQHEDVLTCTLKRDNLPCENERWMGLTLDEMKDSTIFPPKDIFEQAIYSIAKTDMEEILPEYISSKVKGVSWRILISVSGENDNIFHYDSDEDTDYAIPETPLVYPLLSVVTYMNDYGEPTTVYEHTQISSNSSIVYEPAAVYVSMPKQNKHIAFDPRLFHGSSAPISKEVGKLRIAIGTNYHTSQSLETINEGGEGKLDESHVVAPISDLQSQVNEALTIAPWNKVHNMALDIESRKKWNEFYLMTFGNGFDFCGELHSPCALSSRLPTQLILSYDERNPGSTFGFQIQDGDFTVQRMKNGEKYRPPPGSTESIDIAKTMLKVRCGIYHHNETAMSPPLNKCD